MAANPWKAPLEKAIQGNEDNFVNKCMQLATVREDGRPTCRTLLFRGLVGPTDAIAFYGDRRTRKVQEIAKNPWGEIAWWFAGTFEQFRLAGRLRVITADETDEELQKERIKAWAEMDNSDPGRQHPNWPMPRTNRVADDSVFADRDTSASEVSDNFALFLLDVEEVDHYNFGANQRLIYTKQENGGGWTVQSINP